MLVDGFYIFGLHIKFYGILIAAAFVIGLFLAIRFCKMKGYDENLPYSLILVVFPSAIVGARLNYVLFTLDKGWTFVEVLKIWNGGLMIYGGIIFSVIAIAIFCYFKKINFVDVLDMLAPVLILGQAIGRWGNFFNQEAYGSLITNQSFQWFPFGVWIESEHFTTTATQQLIDAYGTSNLAGAWFNATFFYESFWCAGGFVLLLLLFKRTNIRGLTTATYLSFYGFERFFVEMIRTDSLYLGSVKISVLISGLIFVGGLSYLIYVLIKHKKHKKIEVATNGNDIETQNTVKSELNIKTQNIEYESNTNSVEKNEFENTVQNNNSRQKSKDENS